jgi:single-strand DNA-binding protein
MVNKVILIGNLGRDPEVRSTPAGQSVAKFSIATTRKWNDRDGNRQEATEWHNIVVWGRQAEIAGQYLTKGKQIYLEGRLQTSSWDDRETGQKKYRTEVICDNFQMLGRRDERMDPGSPPAQYDSGSSDSGGGGGFDAGAEDDDIPF